MISKAEMTAKTKGQLYQSLREKLNSTSRKRKEIEYGTAGQGQSTIDLFLNHPKQSLLLIRETMDSPLKNLNENV